ncbi:MAG: TolC family protein [Candidatus Cryptobacteroides sp.]|jgi:outer membrane protein
MKTKIIALMLGFMPLTAPAQEPFSPKESQVQNNFPPKESPAKESTAQKPFSLKECLDYAVEHNDKLQKDKLSMESAIQSKREIVGALLPQINAFSGLNYNIQKTTIAMPNFVNSMMPAAMQDPNAPKYMTVTMGMDYGANWGGSISQQIVNFSLFNALNIADLSGEMTEIGAKINTEDVIAQTAGLYYSIQVLTYAVELFDESIALMDRTLQMLEVNKASGLMRPVDVKQLSVNKINLETEKLSMIQAIDIQKNLLKLQMGFPMDEKIELPPINIKNMEEEILTNALTAFDMSSQLSFKMFKSRQKMLDLQYKAAVYGTLPMLSLSANYAMNYMGDDFKGETFHKFPVSAISLNLRVPIFTGLSKTAGIKKAQIERQKSLRDERSLSQSLAMAYGNALMSLEQSRKIMDSQKRNKEMAQEVFDVIENNYKEGISSLSDLLNANSALIRSQMNYVNALSGCMKAYIDLKKSNGTISEIKK